MEPRVQRPTYVHGSHSDMPSGDAMLPLGLSLPAIWRVPGGLQAALAVAFRALACSSRAQRVSAGDQE